MSQLKVTDLQVFRGPQHLIQNLSFEMKLGDRLIVFGPNGCGKSTLLGQLAQSTNQANPKIKWNLDHSEVQYVPQESPFHKKTPDYALDFLNKSQLLYQPFKSLNSATLKSKEILQAVDLQDKPLSVLSGGERQKLKIAQALLLRVKALLLDEPFNGVDFQSQQQIQKLLEKLRPQTIQILVLHNLIDIKKMNADVLWIQETRAQVLSSQDWFKKIDFEFHKLYHLGGEQL